MKSHTGLPAAHRSIALIGVLAIAAIAIVVAGDELSRHLATIDAWMQGSGPFGIVLFVTAYVVVTSALIPESLLAATAGALFGFWWGLGASLIAGIVAATLQYGVGSHWLRAPLLRFSARRPAWRSVQGAMTKDARRLQWLLRLAPFNPATISYLSGASGVRFGSFLLACSALTPHVALEVWGGHAARHLIDASRASAGTHYLHDALLIGGFVAALVVLHQVSRTARQALTAAVHEPGAAEHEPSYDAHNPAAARSTRS